MKTFAFAALFVATGVSTAQPAAAIILRPTQNSRKRLLPCDKLHDIDLPSASRVAAERKYVEGAGAHENDDEDEQGARAASSDGRAASWLLSPAYLRGRSRSAVRP